MVWVERMALRPSCAVYFSACVPQSVEMGLFPRVGGVYFHTLGHTVIFRKTP